MAQSAPVLPSRATHRATTSRLYRSFRKADIVSAPLLTEQKQTLEFGADPHQQQSFSQTFASTDFSSDATCCIMMMHVMILFVQNHIFLNAPDCSYSERDIHLLTLRDQLARLSCLTILAVSAATLPAVAQGTPEETGTFHGDVHATSGTVSIYPGKNGAKTLRLTNFKTSNGPDVHVLLVAADDAQDNQKFLPGSVERVELGKLKGNQGDQNYTIPAGTDLSKFKTVLVYCERFNATFGAAPLQKF